MGHITWIKSIADNLRNGDISNVDKFKSFLRMSCIKLHYLSSHVSLILHDRKCTRNQVKRAHKLTIKHIDVSSRFYIRLMLEVLRHGQFIENQPQSKQEQQKQIKAIYGYIKIIFTQNQNTFNVLPFVVMVAIYAYLAVDDEVILQFDPDSKTKNKPTNNKEEDSDDEPILNQHKNTIYRRITFLKYMILQLFNSSKIQGAYLHLIASTVVYLYKLMEKCPEYQSETEKLRKLLNEWMPKEWAFISGQFNDCPAIKRKTATSIQAFDQNITTQSMQEQEEQQQIQLNVSNDLKKVVVNYYNHIYIAKQ